MGSKPAARRAGEVAAEEANHEGWTAGDRNQSENIGITWQLLP